VDQIPHRSAAADQEKRFVALSSVVAAVVLTGSKLGIGVATGSLGILSEAAHSGLDLVAAFVTFLAVRVSGRPADREHTYGHGKVENVSALFETLLLLATCVWIVYEAIQRLFFDAEVHVQATPWAFAVMILSIVVDYSRSRALSKVARRTHSQALEADALHFSTDIWSSAVVIAGLGCVALADRLEMPWLKRADAVAGLGVAVIVVAVSLKLARRALDDLLDAVSPEMHERVVRAAQVTGVLDVKQVRMRRSGPDVFVDVTLAVSREAAFERAHDVASEAEEAIRHELPGADVVVHMEPMSAEGEGLLTTIRLLAARNGLGAHGIRVYFQAGRRSVGLHVEVDESLTLREAHDQVTAFEKALRRVLPDLDEIQSHIEPRGDASAMHHALSTDERPIQTALEDLQRESTLRWEAHDLRVQKVHGELAVSFHVVLEPETSIADAHHLTEQVEKGLRERVPNLGRITIHVEPP